MKAMIALLLATAGAGAGPGTIPDGRRVHAGDRCSVLALNGSDVGLSRQVIRATRLAGRRVFDIVIHQSVPAKAFDMRDHFVLDARDLTPIAFDNRRNGTDHVRLRYAAGRVTGTRMEQGTAVPIDQPLAGRTWEGNLYGVTFAALPLRKGARFEVPFYQYDKGIGRFALHVTGSEMVETPAGKVPAWVVDVDPGGPTHATYLIAKADGAEVGTRAGQFTSRLGGDCGKLD